MKKGNQPHWERVHQELGEILCHLTKVEFSHYGQERRWRPAINAYRCNDCFIICMDLAGVEKEAIDVRVEARRLLIRGCRPAPEPVCETPEGIQVFTMEIDNGDFERELILPVEVDAERVTAEHRNGLLWINLPLLPHG